MSILILAIGSLTHYGYTYFGMLTVVILTVVILTMVRLTMAILTMAILTMAILAICLHLLSAYTYYMAILPAARYAQAILTWLIPHQVRRGAGGRGGRPTERPG